LELPTHITKLIDLRFRSGWAKTIGKLILKDMRFTSSNLKMIIDLKPTVKIFKQRLFHYKYGSFVRFALNKDNNQFR